MINKLSFYDFDGTLAKSPLPDSGKEQWSQYYGQSYPHNGWWGRPESLDTDVFNIELYPSTTKLIKDDINNPETYVIILTSRIERIKPYIENILTINGIHPDIIDVKKDEKSKGEKVIEYVNKFPDVTRVDVYDDNYEREITSFKSVRDKMPNHIKYNIFHASDGMLTLVERKYNIQNIIAEEIEKYLYGF
jgi:hypothetical protein